MDKSNRIVLAIAAVMGCSGVILAAMASHVPSGSNLTPAASMLSLAAPALIAISATRHSGLLVSRLGLVSALTLALGAIIFAADLTLRTFVQMRLFPMAAPLGGGLMILAWIVLGVATLRK